MATKKQKIKSKVVRKSASPPAAKAKRPAAKAKQTAVKAKQPAVKAKSLAAKPAAAKRTEKAKFATKVPGRTAVVAAEPVGQRGTEIQEYTKAIALFNAGKFQQAEPLFRQLSDATTIEIAHAARMRLLMCQQRANALK